jgi:hypothetical protein
MALNRHFLTQPEISAHCLTLAILRQMIECFDLILLICSCCRLRSWEWRCIPGSPPRRFSSTRTDPWPGSPLETSALPRYCLALPNASLFKDSVSKTLLIPIRSFVDPGIPDPDPSLFVRIQIRFLPLSSEKNSKKNLDFYCFVTLL